MTRTTTRGKPRPVKREKDVKVNLWSRMSQALVGWIPSYVTMMAELRASKREIRVLERQLLRELRHKADLEEQVKRLTRSDQDEEDDEKKEKPKQRVVLIAFDGRDNWFGTPGTAINRKSEAEVHCWGGKGHLLGDGSKKAQDPVVEIDQEV